MFKAAKRGGAVYPLPPFLRFCGREDTAQVFGFWGLRSAQSQSVEDYWWVVRAGKFFSAGQHIDTSKIGDSP